MFGWRKTSTSLIREASQTQGSLLTQNDTDFITERLPAVTGWLLPGAAYFTAYLLNFQASRAIKGPILEFGVYEGKYLLLLNHLARKQGDPVCGVDIFELCSPDTTLAHATEFFGTTEGLSLHTANSGNLTKQDVLGMLGNVRPRFISVDGSHTGPGVFADLNLAASVLADDGVMVIDDLGNPYAMGVAEGAYRFLLAPRCDIVPFAYVQNKMFLCHRRNQAAYHAGALAFTVECPRLPIVEDFEKLKRNGDNWVNQELLGVHVLVFN
jgi:hypothetical protein